MRRVVLQAWIPGRPAPQGSMQPFKRGPSLGVRAANDPVLKPWRAQVTSFAMDEWAGKPALEEPVVATLEFVFRRPKGHTSPASGKLTKDGREQPVPMKRGQGDIDKLTRAVLDGLTDAGVIRDDSLVASLHARKTWGSNEGVHVWIETTKETSDADG